MNAFLGQKGVFLMLLALSLSILLMGASDPDKKETKVKSNSALSKQLDEICGDFCKVIEMNNDDRVFDSLAYHAIQKAEASFDPKLILKVNLRYLEKVQIPGSFVDYKSVAERSEMLTLKNKDSKNNFASYITLSQSAIRLRNKELSHRYALKAFSEASMTKDPLKKVSAYLVLGKSLEFQQHYVEAYQNFLNAYYQSELISDLSKKREKQIKCYKHFAYFFGELNDFEQAAEYKNKEINQILEYDHIDSTALYMAKLDLWGIAVRAGKYYDLPEKFEEIIDYSIRTGNLKMKDYTFASYRTYLIQNADYKGFKKLYVDNYPEELERMKSSRSLLYYRIKAYISEYEKDLDMSIYYYEEAEKQTGIQHNNVFRSNFYRRLGEFYFRNNDLKNAKNNFQKSFDLAKQSDYIPYMYETSAFLDSVSIELGDTEEAYKYSKIHQELHYFKDEQVKNKDFLLLEIQNETKRMELTLQQEEIKTKKKYKAQYLIITLCITILMVVFISVSHMKVPVWVVKGSGFLGILMFFEFIILILDQEIHHMTHGAPLWIFIIKVSILTVLFPLHHVIEHNLINFMLKNKLLKKPAKGSLKKIAKKLWPWLSEN